MVEKEYNYNAGIAGWMEISHIHKKVEILTKSGANPKPLNSRTLI